MLYLFVVVVATVLGAVLYLPQLVLLLRTGSVSGLSTASLVNGSISFAAWSVYLAVDREWLLLVANLVPSLVWWTVTAVALPKLRPPLAGFAPSVLWAGVLLAGASAGWAVFGSLLAVSVVWCYLPAAVSAWRSPTLHGVSAAAWALCALEGGTWLAAGLLRDNGPVISYGAFAAVLAAVVLAAVVLRRDRSPQARPALDDPGLAAA